MHVLCQFRERALLQLCREVSHDAWWRGRRRVLRLSGAALRLPRFAQDDISHYWLRIYLELRGGARPSSSGGVGPAHGFFGSCQVRVDDWDFGGGEDAHGPEKIVEGGAEAEVGVDEGEFG